MHVLGLHMQELKGKPENPKYIRVIFFLFLFDIYISFLLFSASMKLGDYW